MRPIYRETRHICKDYMDIQIYPVYDTARTRGPKRRPSREMQKKLNEENAKKKLVRLVHTNFTWNDFEVTFTYKDKYLPQDENEAKRQIQNFFRRAKRLYAKNGITLKYIWIMERAAETGRIHFHAFLSGGVDRTKLEGLWKFGYANTVALRFDEKGVAGLVYYDVKNRLLYRRWNGSKNLEKPTEKKRDGLISAKRAAELYTASQAREDFKDAYPLWEKRLGAYEISEIKAFKNEWNGGYYLTVQLYRKQARLL